LVAQLSDQTPIQLRNASFEDIPRNSRAPVGWNDCGFPAESPPDVHPDPINQFQVGMRPEDGRTYLGMVVRDNDTWESVGQELSEPLVGGQCYEFRISLARSRVYLSQSRVANRAANYVTPTKLRIHGGYDYCDRMQMIGETETIKNYDWQEYAIKLNPEEDFTHIVLEVFFKTPTLIPYNGNLLLDNASPLVPIECDEEVGTSPFFEDAVAMQETLRVVNPVPEPEPISPRPQLKNPQPKPEPEIVLGKTKGVLKVDAIFEVPDITFTANESKLTEESSASLQEIVDFLTINERVIIEIGGHASQKATNDFANRVSMERAESVVEYLRIHGIDQSRMFPRGYGKQKPVCYDESLECKRRNQRVDVKILKLE
jgi:outer membrane protein OmpA-like peptidoglycan-associated protein